LATKQTSRGNGGTTDSLGFAALATKGMSIVRKNTGTGDQFDEKDVPTILVD
jgi:hypothetical protein